MNMSSNPRTTTAALPETVGARLLTERKRLGLLKSKWPSAVLSVGGRSYISKKIRIYRVARISSLRTKLASISSMSLRGRRHRTSVDWLHC